MTKSNEYLATGIQIHQEAEARLTKTKLVVGDVAIGNAIIDSITVLSESDSHIEVSVYDDSSHP